MIFIKTSDDCFINFLGKRKKTQDNTNIMYLGIENWFSMAVYRYNRHNIKKKGLIAIVSPFEYIIPQIKIKQIQIKENGFDQRKTGFAIQKRQIPVIIHVAGLSLKMNSII